MKMLDEVIKANECCDHGDLDSRCEDCPYSGIGACCAERETDALYYLKTFRDAKNTLDAERERIIEAYCQWEDAKEKFEAQTSQMMWVNKHFQFEISDNLPLTWDELQQMEGEPVWIETDNMKFWTVIDNFRIICNQECLCCSKGYMCRSTHTRGDWQAYRKEH